VLFELVDALWALDQITPDELAARLGVRLELYEDKFGYARYRATHALGAIEVGYRASEKATWFGVTVASSQADRGEMVARYGLGSFNVDPPQLGTTSNVFYRAKRRVEMRWVWHSDTSLKGLSIGWSPNAPPPWIFLQSYDRVDQHLQLWTKHSNYKLLPADPAHPITLGAFVFEYKRHLGVYASPTGPVFFMDSTKIDGAFGEVTVTAQNKRFRVAKGRLEFEIPYEPRTGLFTNPYDNEQADIDLFALMERGATREEWWKAYTRPWVELPA